MLIRLIYIFLFVSSLVKVFWMGYTILNEAPFFLNDLCYIFLVVVLDLVDISEKKKTVMER